jgi:vanadium-dependent haloperoxidase-like protein
MKARSLLLMGIALAVLLVGVAAGQASRLASDGTATLPAGNAVQQWDQLAADTVVKSGALQIEGFQYMAYVSGAVYNATVSIDGGYKPWGPKIKSPAGASSSAAVVQAAYDVLVHYFPAPRAAGSPDLDAAYAESLAAIPDGPAKTSGIAVGRSAAQYIISLRTGDGLTTPIASTSSLPVLPPAAGVWRLTPPGYLAPQTPWVASMKTYVLRGAGEFLPPPPPALSSAAWATAFAEIKDVGSATSTTRTLAQSNIAKFWTANVVLQYNQTLRDFATSNALSPRKTARLMAMVNIVAADGGIATLYAKYHYRFWRPVTAIDPSSMQPGGDLFGTTADPNDGNAATVEEAGWRPLIVTPNHPEYPAAHGVVSSEMAEIYSQFLHSNQINLTVPGFDPSGPAGNLNATQTFATADDLRTQIVNARLWGGVHYRFSGEAGVKLGEQVAQYDLRHAFTHVGKPTKKSKHGK